MTKTFLESVHDVGFFPETLTKEVDGRNKDIPTPGGRCVLFRFFDRDVTTNEKGFTMTSEDYNHSDWYVPGGYMEGGKAYTRYGHRQNTDKGFVLVPINGSGL